MHPNGVPCSKRRGWDSYKSLAFRVMGALAQSSQVSKNALWLCHPERNASEVEGSSDSVKMRCERMLAFWAFPCPRARSGYILGATAFATLAAHLLERSLACASLRHTVVTIPNAWDFFTL